MVYDCLQETLPALLNHNDDTKCENMYIYACMYICGSDHYVMLMYAHREFPKGKRVLPPKLYKWTKSALIINTSPCSKSSYP